MLSKRAWHTIASVIGTCIVGYFIYHTIEGDRGWVAQVRLQNEVAETQKKLDGLRQESESLDRRVRLLRPESLDPDLLDEEARKSLNYTKPGEIVVINPNSGSSIEKK